MAKKTFFTKKENLKEIWENLKKICRFWSIYRTTLIISFLSMFKHWLWNGTYSHCGKSVQIGSFFWSVFSCIRTEYRDLRNKSPCSVRVQENTDRKLSVFGHFSRTFKYAVDFLSFFSAFTAGKFYYFFQ